MNWEEWIDVPTIKTLTQHSSASLVSLVLFGLIHFAIDKVKLSDVTRITLVSVDEFVLVGLFVWLVWQMACLLWKGRIKNASTNLLMAA